MKESLVLIVAGSALGLVLSVYPTNSVHNETDATALDAQVQAVSVRLKIPRINVDAAIEQVGLTSEGAMDVPKGPDDVALFSPGTHPGQIGSAVIAGHRGWKNGRAAVFDNLNTLRKGDTVSVEDANGNTVSFIVRETRIYNADANAPEVFLSADGIHLNLVTCAGDWDALKKSNTERLVVFTDLVQ